MLYDLGGKKVEDVELIAALLQQLSSAYWIIGMIPSSIRSSRNRTDSSAVIKQCEKNAADGAKFIEAVNKCLSEKKDMPMPSLQLFSVGITG